MMPLQNIEVSVAATAWDHPENGRTYILGIPSGLMVREKLPNSLINPNQSRVYGISLCDDPFDPFGVEVKIPKQD
jgi:hypothetical protein